MHQLLLLPRHLLPAFVLAPVVLPQRLLPAFMLAPVAVISVVLWLISQLLFRTLTVAFAHLNVSSEGNDNDMELPTVYRVISRLLFSSAHCEASLELWTGDRPPLRLATHQLVRIQPSPIGKYGLPRTCRDLHQ